MEEQPRRILHRVGVVLIIVGCVDIGSMIYSIVQGMKYQSSLNIFAVIAGIFLIRGNLRAVGVIRAFAAFLLAGFVSIVVVAPFSFPFDLLATEFRLKPESFGLDFVVGLIVIALLFWVVRDLGREPVLACIRAKGIKPRQIKFVLAGGFLLPILLVLASHSSLGGDRALHAEQLAEQQVGAGYKFWVTSINITAGTTGTRVRVAVTAWNHDEVHDIPVAWIEN